MKSLFIRDRALLAACACLLAGTASAQTRYTSTGWVNQVLSPPIICPTPLGQVLFRGTAFAVRMDSTDPRLTGKRTVFSNGYLLPDGSSVVYGAAYQEVGTWTGSNFTANGGLWELQWRGVMQTNYGMQHSVVGYGSGGAVDGLRLEESSTRAEASGPFDPAVPFLYSGTIRPPPLDANQVVDNFDDNHFTGTIWGSGSIVESNQQFNAIGDFKKPTSSLNDSFLFAGYRNAHQTISDGMTLEWRADLISLDDTHTNTAILGVGFGDNLPGYVFHKGRDFAFLAKWSSSYSLSVLWCERASLLSTNVVMALALTRVQTNLVITARVLDRADPNNVLFSKNVMDTPASDTSLTVAEFQSLTGMRLVDWVADAPEPPPTVADVAVLGVFQYTDGKQPAPQAVWDNLQLRTSEVPPLSIERAVRVSWPALGTINYAVQSAPTVQGPWAPVQDQSIPGLQTMTVPASSPGGFIRLIQAP